MQVTSPLAPKSAEKAPLQRVHRQPSPSPAPSRTLPERFLRSRALVSLVVLIVLTPVYTYYSSLLGLASNADAAINVIEAWDMTHGRPILNGWIQGNNSWMTNELIVYALVAAVLGMTPTVIYVSHGILYSMVIVMTGLLAAGRGRDRGQVLLSCALVAAMLLHITRDTTGWMMLSVIDHLTTSIPLMVMLLVLDRAAMTWRMGAVVFATLTWAATSDHLAIYVGVLPMVLVAGLRAYFRREERLANLALVGGALAAIPADHTFKAGIEWLGGATRNNPPDAIFAGVTEMPANFWETVNGLMIIFGAGLFGQVAGDARSELLHLGVLAVACAGWVIALRSWRRLNLVDQFLITAILVNILAFLFSTMPGPYYTAHELLVVVPFSVALAARLIVPRLGSVRAKVPVYLGAGLAVALLANTLTKPAAPDPTMELTTWLKREGLDYGLSGYWQAATVTVQSHNRVQVAAIINDGHGNVTPFWQVMRDDWYDPAEHDARFIVSGVGAEANSIHDLHEQLLTETFGSPVRTVTLGAYVVRIFDYNLLTRLPIEKLPHQA